MAQTLDKNPLVKAAFETGQMVDESGSPIQIHSQIDRRHAEALYHTVLTKKPAHCVEIGLAFGMSAVSILAALYENGFGELISIDPLQSGLWKSAGINFVRRCGYETRHRVIEGPDYTVLPDLLSQGLVVDFAYIDGWHTFDYTLLDAFYLDKMLSVGGVMVFNDTGWYAIDRVVRYLQSHRRYTEMDVGLPGMSMQDRLRYLLGGAKKRSDRYFTKREQWEPRWDHYAPIDPLINLFPLIRPYKQEDPKKGS